MLFVIPRSALKRVTKTVQGKFIEDIKGELVTSRFAAAEVARDVRYEVRAGTPALRALRMTLSLAATRDGKRRPRIVALYDIVVAFVHAAIDQIVAVLSLDGILERDDGFLLLKELHGTRKASKRWQQHDTGVFKMPGWRASAVWLESSKILRACADALETVSWLRAATN